MDYQPGAAVRQRLESGRPWLRNRITDGEWRAWAHDRGWAEACRAAGVHSALVVPLEVEGQAIGALSLARAGVSPDFTHEDSVVAQELAVRAARCLDRARRYGREHTMALELQRALLTEPSAPHPDLDTATRYLPADDTALIGGDWFDAFALPDGRSLLVIGDVMGHGVEAAVAMSHYRSMLRALACAGLPPHRMLEHADRMVADSGFDRVATCLLALGSPDGEEVVYASAGHLPPARLSPEGRVEIIDLPVGPPLGTGLGKGTYEEVVRPWRIGSVDMLYTDGLVERRGEDIDASLRRLTELRLVPQDPLDTILDAVVAQLVDHPAGDDIAIVAVRNRAE